MLTNHKIRPVSRFYLLDMLRLMAAFAVVMFHYTGRQGPHWSGESTATLFPTLSHITVYGYYGVHLFFVISGFVIFMSVEGRSTPQFLGSRVGRLFPAYWVAVLSTAMLQAWVAPYLKDVSLFQVLVNLTMLQAPLRVPHVDGVYWTLWIELTFYGIIVLLMLFRVSGSALNWFLLVWPIVGFFLSNVGSPALSMGLGAQYAAYFASGMCLYLMYRHGLRPVYLLLFAVNAIVSIWQAVIHAPDVLDHSGDPSLCPVVSGFVIAGILVVVALLTLSRLNQKGGRWMLHAGALTYPLYLIHEWWGWWMIGVVDPFAGQWVAIGCAVVFSLGVAYMVERWVERPLRPWLRVRVQRLLEGRNGRKVDV